MDFKQIDMTLSGLRAHYQVGDFTPLELVQLILAEIEASQRRDNNPIWINLFDLPSLQKFIQNLPTQPQDDLPLYGVPFAIKDNIDVAGVPTTAACAAFSYLPKYSAYVVEQLLTAGAVPIGKTNMDQFATGLVGTRSPSPWGACRNALNGKYISGGSSSGSALAVAKGWVSFALGTDTAGSGRVPASLNNIVGLKPTRGLLSTTGVVPACRSLDCVSIFALSAADANCVFDVAAKFDGADAYARVNRYSNSVHYFAPPQERVRLGVPHASQLEFFDDSEAATLFSTALNALSALDVDIVEIDLDPFAQAAKLLYGGAWVAERYLATQALMDTQPESLLPVIRTIIGGAKDLSAADAFAAEYQLRELKQQAEVELDKVDAIITPTNGTIYTIGEVEKDPIQLNSNLGYYTNFMNLFDCAAVAVPAGFYQSGVAFGLTVFHRAYTDKRLLSLVAALQNSFKLPLGASTKPYRPSSDVVASQYPRENICVVVCGAHLQGLPLNRQLTERAGMLLKKTTTADNYRLFALAGGPPARPGLLRDEQNGAAIEVEVWSLPAENFGSFVAEVPAPLGIGKIELADGNWQPGFICEPHGIATGKDVTHWGGWRNYLASIVEK